MMPISGLAVSVSSARKGSTTPRIFDSFSSSGSGCTFSPGCCGSARHAVIPRTNRHPHRVRKAVEQTRRYLGRPRVLPAGAIEYWHTRFLDGGLVAKDTDRPYHSLPLGCGTPATHTHFVQSDVGIPRVLGPRRQRGTVLVLIRRLHTQRMFCTNCADGGSDAIAMRV